MFTVFFTPYTLPQTSRGTLHFGLSLYEKPRNPVTNFESTSNGLRQPWPNSNLTMGHMANLPGSNREQLENEKILYIRLEPDIWEAQQISEWKMLCFESDDNLKLNRFK